jgi:hypothetical protein
LPGVEPVLERTREQTVRDVPEIGFVVGLGDLVAEVDRLAKCVVEGMFQFLHRGSKTKDFGDGRF